MDHTEKLKKAQQLSERAQSMLENATKVEQRDMTEDEAKEYDQMHADASALIAEVKEARQKEQEQREREERQEKLAREIIATTNYTAKQADEQADERKAFRDWLRTGEHRALTTGGTNLGAEFVPQDFSDFFVKKLQDLDSVIAAGARVLVTDNGHDILVPVLNDTSNTGELIAENAAVASDVEPATSQITLRAYIFSSKSVLVSDAMLEDSAFPVEDWVGEALADRISKVANTYETTGTGTAQPQGVVNGATDSGVSVASTTAVTYNEILDLIGSLPRVYRSGAKLMCNNTTHTALKKLVDGNGNPLWNAGNIAAGIPSTIDGYEVIINDGMANMAASAKFLLFGSFNIGYVVRLVRSIQLKRVSDKYKEQFAVAFVAGQRRDGRYVDTAAVNYLQNASS